MPDHELAIQLWELAMAGDRDTDAFMRIDAEIHRRKSSQYALRLETITPSAPKARMPVFLASFATSVPQGRSPSASEAMDGRERPRIN